MKPNLLPLFAVGAALTACNMAPTYVRPVAPIPATWPTAAAGTGHNAGMTAATIAWRDVMLDAKLAKVIDRALVDGRDLRIAIANVASARAQYRVQRSARLPTVAANASASDTNGGLGAADVKSSSVELGISAFEIDLFGKQRNLSRAAFEDYLASAEGARSARLALIVETATAWLTLAADRDLLAIARDTAISAERSLAISRQLNAGGLTGKLDVRSAETVLAQARSDVENYTTQAAQDRNALELLVGAPVTDDLLPDSIAALDGAIARVPAGLSSHILLSRPDVLQAEHQLQARNADIGAARAAFFPTISLTSAIGLASSSLTDLFGNGGLSWSVSPSASVPVLGGDNRANLAYAKAQYDVYLATYEQTVQTAFKEVADGLARVATIDRQIAAQAALVSASRQSYELADQRYRGGIDTYLNTLDAQRTLYSARQTQVSTLLTDLSNRVALYQALGGGSTDCTMDGSAVDGTAHRCT